MNLPPLTLSHFAALEKRIHCRHSFAAPHYRISTTHEDGSTEREERALCLHCGVENRSSVIVGAE